MSAQNAEKVAMRRCRCGHPRADHTGRLTNGEGWKVLSTTACLHGTTVAGAGTWYAERVGGDRCERYVFSLRETLRGFRFPSGKQASA